MSVVGLGYVGLPIALAFAKQIKVIGFDINAERVEVMRKNIDPSNELAVALLVHNIRSFSVEHQCFWRCRSAQQLGCACGVDGAAEVHRLPR